MNNKSVLTKDLYKCDIPFLKESFNNSTYPWEIVPKISYLINELIKNGIPGYTLIKEGVLVGSNVSIAPTATIIPPAIIGSNTEIRPGAFLRGNVITGENCVLGNSSEFKNCILLYHVQAPHYNYVGDSILGNYAHMGAGSICSNLKSDKKEVIVHSDKDYKTGLKKLGAMIGDNVEVGCQSVLNPGTIIGQDTQIYPLCTVRGVIPSNSIYKDSNNFVIKEKR